MERVQMLTEAVRDLRAEGAQIRVELSRRTTLLAWMFAAGGVILVLCIAAAYTVSLSNQRAIEDSDRKWCPMVALLIPQRGQAPATTVRGREISASALRLYREFGCDH